MAELRILEDDAELELFQIEEDKRENPCSYPDYPTAHEVVEGITTGMIDYAAELQELQDDIADRQFWARGEW